MVEKEQQPQAQDTPTTAPVVSVPITTVNRMAIMRSMFRKSRFITTHHMHIKNTDQYKRVIHTFDPTKFKTLELLHMTDLQMGHVLARVDRITEFRDWILDKPNRFMLWGGDMVDSGTKVSVGSPWEQLKEPQGQVYDFCSLMAPARHRVLAYVGGNHERRANLTFGDLGQMIASTLEIPYSGGQQLVDIKFGDVDPFRISMWHGGGNAVTPGAKLAMLDRFMQRGDSQLYLVGHLHEPIVRFLARPIRQLNGEIKLIKVGGAMSGSFLDYYGGYAEVMNLSAAPLMMARTILEPNGHWELTLR